jgi:hypothetical protein
MPGEYGSAEAWGSVWRSTLLGAAIGVAIYGVHHTEDNFGEGVAMCAGLGAALSGLFQTGAGMFEASRAPRGSVQNESAAAHAMTGFYAGVGGGAVILGVSSAMSRPSRRPRRALP